MNKARRSKIEGIAEKLESLQGELYQLVSEEQEYYDNMPESIQDGVKGEAAQAVIDLLEEAGCSFDELADAVRAAAE